MRVHHYQKLFIARNLYRMQEPLLNMYLSQKWVQRYIRRFYGE